MAQSRSGSELKWLRVEVAQSRSGLELKWLRVEVAQSWSGGDIASCSQTLYLLLC